MPMQPWRTQQTTNTTGTGTLTLNAVAAGRRSMQDSFGVSAKVIRYVISSTNFFEIGIGTYDGGTPGTLTRGVLLSSNSNALVSLAAGTWDVFTYIDSGDRGVTTGSGAMTLTLSDLGNAVLWSGGTNQTAVLPAVATVPDGGTYAFRNAGTAILTLDPNASELINGATTLAMAPGSALELVKIAGAWHAISGPDANASGYAAWGGTAGGTANALTITVSPAPATYIVGQTLKFLVGSTNTAAATLNVNGLGAKNLKRWDGSTDLVVGDLPAGALAEVTYDGTSYRLRPVHSTRFIGEEIAFFGSTLPSGVLWCAGQAVSRTTYAALFTVLATTYGVGDGSTTFNLPDLRGRTGFGRDDMNTTAASRLTNAGSGVAGTTLGAAGGDERLATHTHTATQTAHSHTTQAGGDTGGGLFLAGGSGGKVAPSASVQVGLTSDSQTPAITVANGGTGSSANIPPALVRNVGIYAGI